LQIGVLELLQCEHRMHSPLAMCSNAPRRLRCASRSLIAAMKEEARATALSGLLMIAAGAPFWCILRCLVGC
jgi:hypothetical protein